MLEARAVRKAYGSHTVLSSASLALTPGRTVVLTGDNGSGKTTLLHVLVGLRQPDGGEVVWKDRVLTGAPEAAWREARTAWGFLPQRLEFPTGATVERLLRFHSRLRATPSEQALSWLERVGLGDAASQRVHALSGGMQQRLGIALTLFHRPDVVIMDEPSGSLDPEWRRSLVEWVADASRDGAAVLVTSQLQEAWDDGVQLLHCERGAILAESSGEAIPGSQPASADGKREPRGASGP